MTVACGNVKEIKDELKKYKLPINGKKRKLIERLIDYHKDHTHSERAPKKYRINIECPACLDVPESPIWQCKNGHTTCGGCIQKLNQVCSYMFEVVN
jgi:hypothetical protein